MTQSFILFLQWQKVSYLVHSTIAVKIWHYELTWDPRVCRGLCPLCHNPPLSLPLDSWDSNLIMVDSRIPDSNLEAWIHESWNSPRRPKKCTYLSAFFFKKALALTNLWRKLFWNMIVLFLKGIWTRIEIVSSFHSWSSGYSIPLGAGFGFGFGFESLVRFGFEIRIPKKVNLWQAYPPQYGCLWTPLDPNNQDLTFWADMGPQGHWGYAEVPFSYLSQTPAIWVSMDSP